jgi:hypothetical protein
MASSTLTDFDICNLPLDWQVTTCSYGEIGLPTRQSFSSISLPLSWNRLSNLGLFSEVNLELVYVCSCLASVSS